MKKITQICWLLFFGITAVLSSQSLFGQNYKSAFVQTPCATPNEILTFYRAKDTTMVIATCTTDVYGLCSVSLPSIGNYKVKYGTRWRAEFPWVKISGDTVFLRDVIAKSPFLDVRYFGAKGNGVTDDYLAIQKAIDSLSTGQIGIYMPKGDYLTSQPLKLKNSTKIYGAGSAETGFMTRILYTGTSDFALKTDSTLLGIYNLVLENLVIIGNNADGGIRLGCAKNGYGVSATLRKISIRDFNKYGAVGLQLEGVIHSSFEDIGANRINGKAMRIIASSDIQPGPINFLNCVFGSSSTPSESIGVEIEAVNAGIHTLNFMGSTFSGCKRAGVLIKAGTGGNRASNIAFWNNTFELNVYDNSKGIEIEELFSGAIISNSFTAGNKNGGIGIYFPRTKTAQGITISNNSVVSYAGTNSYFVRVDSTGQDFLDNFYGNQRLIAVTTEISDPAFKLRYYQIRSGTAFPFTNPPMQMFYRTTDNVLGIWNGTTWRLIPTQ